MDHVRPDRCPGALRPFVSGDGAMVRVRRPGGRVSVAELRGLLDLSTRHGGADLIQLTSRGNLQLRALPDPLPEGLVADLAPWLPAPDHERVRNIIASPLSDAAHRVATAFDRLLCADPTLAGLPGRFLAAIDTDGDVIGEPFDLAWCDGWLHLGGHQVARPVSAADAPQALAEVAHRFQQVRRTAWHVREVEPTAFGAGWEPRPVPAGRPLPCGAHGDRTVAGVPLGFLTRGLVTALEDARVAHVTITPWRQLVVPGPRVPAGFTTDPDNPWARITACVGAPACHRTGADTLARARELAETAATDAAGMAQRVHVVGCQRRCGAPRDARVEVVPEPA